MLFAVSLQEFTFIYTTFASRTLSSVDVIRHESSFQQTKLYCLIAF